MAWTLRWGGLRSHPHPVAKGEDHCCPQMSPALQLALSGRAGLISSLSQNAEMKQALDDASSGDQQQK